MPNDPASIEAVALLEEPVRRALYEWVVRDGGAVSRDQAAAGVGVSRALAAFHLDRLVEGGLLSPEYRRLSGRTGPGAGRPAKLYRRGPRQVTVSLPDRSYEVAALLFADTIEGTQGEIPPAPLRVAARGLGRSAGARARKEAGPRPTRKRLRAGLMAALRERGYEPRESDGAGIRLGNCPFHALVEDHRQLVCGMNLALAEGMIDGLGDDRVTARLDPQPGWCCVAIDTERPAH
ncbi:MAG TPA: helix-turn-helix domain-containing protein [Candidatus Limnocylindrales bacterium]